MVTGIVSHTRKPEFIKVSKMRHALRNVEQRKGDADAKTLALQQERLEASITRDRGIGNISPKDINWLDNAFFRVERMKDGTYEVLAGSHRLEFFERAQKLEKEAIAAKDAKFIGGWGEVEIPCYVYECSSDAERDAIIMLDNGDGEEAGTRIKMPQWKRFRTAYTMMPPCNYAVIANEKDVIKFVAGTPQGWSSDEYQRETHIGGSAHVPYSALTRMGRHFSIPVDVFNENRLYIESQLTAAYLVKDAKRSGDTNPKTKDLPEGIETRYKKARAFFKAEKKADGTMTTLDDVKATYKAEFMELMDIDTDENGTIIKDINGNLGGTGESSLHKKPKLSKEEKKQQKEEKEKQDKEAAKASAKAVAGSATYSWERYAIGHAFAPTETNEVSPDIGNALDLIFRVAPEALKGASEALAKAQEKPTDAALNNAAAAALGNALLDLVTMSKVTPISTEHKATPHAIAAHAEKNTAKKKK